MSTLQKVEEAYLGILRLVIIVASSILLIAAVVLGLMSFSGLRGGDKAEPVETSVQSEEVIGKVAAEPEKDKAAPRKSQGKANGDNLTPDDPNKPYYVRTTDAIVKFANKYAPGYFEIKQDNVINYLTRKAERYKGDSRLVTTFAAGLADTMDKALANPAIIKRVEKPAKAALPAPAPAPAPQGDNAEAAPPSVEELPFKESPLQIAEEIVETYSAIFDKKEADKELAKARQAAEEIARKEAAMMQLYVAGGAFASFLFLVFISIVVKIERNLRNISAPAKCPEGSALGVRSEDTPSVQ